MRILLLYVRKCGILANRKTFDVYCLSIFGPMPGKDNNNINDRNDFVLIF